MARHTSRITRPGTSMINALLFFMFFTLHDESQQFRPDCYAESIDLLRLLILDFTFIIKSNIIYVKYINPIFFMQ